MILETGRELINELLYWILAKLRLMWGLQFESVIGQTVVGRYESVADAPPSLVVLT